MSAYYNEHDPFAAAWLRELIKGGHIADGEVDERSIVDVTASDVRGFDQCHWFAGIGGWSLALRLARWPDDRRIWTGSCPCQPFSSAGTQAGGNDPRDLWPAWFQLLKECRPDVVVGEQVAAAVGHGWLDRLCDDLEGEGYAVGPVCLPACSVGAFHIRQRLWFVADTTRARERWGGVLRSGEGDTSLVRSTAQQRSERTSVSDDVADPDGGHTWDGDAQRSWEHGLRAEGRRATRGEGDAERAEVEPLADPDTAGSSEQRGTGLSLERDAPRGHDVDGRSEAGGVVDAISERGRCRQSGRKDAADVGKSGEAGFWSDVLWLPCRDGKARPTQPGLEPLVAGLSGGMVPSGDPSASYATNTAEARVMRLRGYGNSVVPQVAAEVIRAYMEIRS